MILPFHRTIVAVCFAGFLLCMLAIACPADAQTVDPPKVPQSVRVAQVVFLLSNVADVASTEWAIAQGASEANPLMRGGRGNRIAGKVLASTIVWAITSKQGAEKPKATKVLLYALSGLNFGISANNVRLGFTVSGQ